jgi:ATP-binding cassette subfamily F protein 3
MEKLQNRLQQIEALLGDSHIYEDANKIKLQELLAEQTKLQPQLADCEENWLAVSEEIESASS